MTQQILIVSEDVGSERLRSALADRGFEVTIAENAATGYDSLVASGYDLVVAVLEDPVAGVNLIQRIRAEVRLERLLVLAVAEWGTGQATLALAEGADAFEPKPIDADRLVKAVERLLRPSMAMSAKASKGESED